MRKPSFNMGTVLLEVNRWRSRIPSFKVSDWVDRFAADGFDGIELWENHVLLADGELAALQKAKLPVSVYNMYADFSDESKEKLAKALENVHALKPAGIKYNFGEDSGLMPVYRKNLLAFAAALPANCVMLCEVHQGSVLEDVDVAADFFKDLPKDKFQIISHVFTSDTAGLQKQFDAFGDRIVLAHVQFTVGGQRVRLDRDADTARECLRIMKANGFAGDFTMEFTEGTAAPDETIEMLYENAKRDMQFIKENWR